MPFGMKAVEAGAGAEGREREHLWSPMPFGMKAVEALMLQHGIKASDLKVTNAFRHEGR